MIRHYILLLTSLLGIISCSGNGITPDDNNGNNNKPGSLKVECSTLDASDVYHNSAILNGKYAITGLAQINGNTFFYFSNRETSLQGLKTNGTRFPVTGVSSAEGSFSLEIHDLSPSTEYYFVAAILVGETEYFGNVTHFSTAAEPVEPVITGDYANLGESFVTLYGYSTLAFGDYLPVSFGFEYSETDLTKSAITVSVDNKDSNSSTYSLNCVLPNSVSV